MNVHEAIDRACAEVGIQPPRSYQPGKWAKCDTLDGKSGKGDGRVNVDEMKVTAFNWKLGQSATIWLKDRASLSQVEKRQFAERKAKDEAEQRERADSAARIAQSLLSGAALATHPYFAAKGFPAEQAMCVPAKAVREIAGDYLVAGERAIVVPARIRASLTSCQLIWEDGTKKFLAGGAMGGAVHRIAKGRDTWLCEGYATGLSLRVALKSLNRADTILVCFSAFNIVAVARSINGRCFIAADHDKPMPQFDGLGTGEHWARAAGKPYAMPPALGDINDMHMQGGIFAVQKLVSELIRRAR